MRLLSLSLPFFAIVSQWLVGFGLACGSACDGQFVSCQGLCTQRYGGSPTVWDCKNQCALDYQLCCPPPMTTGGSSASAPDDNDEEGDELQRLMGICEATFREADADGDLLLTMGEYFRHADLFAGEICPGVARAKTYADSDAFASSHGMAACASCTGALDPTHPASGGGTYESCGCADPVASNLLIKPLDTALEKQVYCTMVYSLALVQCHQPEDACLDTCHENDGTCWQSCEPQYQTSGSIFFICLHECEPIFLTCVNKSCSTTNAVITTDAGGSDAAPTDAGGSGKNMPATSAVLVLPMIALVLLHAF